MAKPRTPNQKKRYKELNKRLDSYTSLVLKIYEDEASDVSRVVQTITNYNGGKEFRFKDYPEAKASIDQLMRSFSQRLRAVIMAGGRAEWGKSNAVQDLLVEDVRKVYGINKKEASKMFRSNENDLRAFQKRLDNRGSVAQKVWNQQFNLKRELECAISCAMQKSNNPASLTKNVIDYLHHFERLRADYKKYFGKDIDCQDCEYRSRRLVRSEINIAYRTAEQTRWQQMDFIKGYEIKISSNHHKKDICDELAGIYPKRFKWVGWHPNCRCYVVPIVMDYDELQSGKGQIITELPENFKMWFYDNGERIMAANRRGTLPYWISDNKTKLSEDLQTARRSAEGTKMSRKAHNDIINSLGKEDVPTYKSEQEENHKIIEKILGIQKKPFMSFQDADSGRGNSMDDGSPAFGENCQCCVVAHELRRRGFDVTAMGNTGTPFYKQLEDDTAMGWLTRNGKEIKVNNIKSEKNDEDELYKKLMKQIGSGGRYTIEWDYKDKTLDGHIVCSEVIDGKLVIYDPQKNGFWSLHEILEVADISTGIGILRVDGLVINPSHIKKIVTTP